MDLIIKSDKDYRLGSVERMHETLPAGTYILDMSQEGEFFLTLTDDLKYPEKLYGDMSIVDRWINTYRSRTGNLGILLSGLKGSGKTITAKKLAMETGLPIIMIKAPFTGLRLKKFLSDKRLGDCVVFVDEFEKIYQRDDQIDFLELLDGTMSTHHMFVFTVNSENISDKMLNRPSRIFYRKRYSSLEEPIIREVAEDLLENKAYEEDLVDTLENVIELSYDILISVIGEVNRYGLPASSLIKDMCLDWKPRRLIPFQRINMDGDDYFYLPQGTRGICIDDEESSFIDLRYALPEPEDDPSRRPSSSSNGPHIFGKVPEETTAKLSKAVRKMDNVNVYKNNIVKVSKREYEVSKALGGGRTVDFVFIENKGQRFFEGNVIFTREELDNIVVSGGKPEVPGIPEYIQESRMDDLEYDCYGDMDCCVG